MSYKIENGKLILDDNKSVIHGDLYLCGNADVIKLPDNLQVRGSIYLLDIQIEELPDNLKVDGYLDLQGTQIKELPINLQVHGSLNLQGTQIKKLPNNLKVGGYLDLENTQIKELPINLQVVGSLYLQGTQIENYPISYNCGRENRVIYLNLKDKNLIRIGCFKGTKEEAIRAIREKYTGDERDEYITKVEECFAMWDFEKDEFIWKKD